MRSMGFELSKSEVKALMAIIDTDGNGTVELDEYIELMKDRLVLFKISFKKLALLLMISSRQG